MKSLILKGGLTPYASLTPAASGSPWKATHLLFASLSMLILSSCGFEPVHGRAERASRTGQLESVHIQTDNTRQGQLLKAEIQDQINPAGIRAEKPFTLQITLNEVEVPLFINPDGTSGRGDIQYNSHFVLSRTKDQMVISSGNITRISSYNISETADYGTYVSREDARKRGVQELAQDYKLRLANLITKLNNPVAETSKEPEVEQVAPLIRVQDNHENRTTGF